MKSIRIEPRKSHQGGNITTNGHSEGTDIIAAPVKAARPSQLNNREIWHGVGYRGLTVFFGQAKRGVKHND